MCSITAYDLGLRVMLQAALEMEWKKRSDILPGGRESPPPSAPQKVHPAVPAPPPAPSLPLPSPPRRTTTPMAQSPAPSTSTAQHQTRRMPTRPRSPVADMDVDVSGMSPEPEGRTEEMGMARDEQGEEIVRQLEKGLPRWEGLGDQGWGEIDPVRPFIEFRMQQDRI